MREETRLLLNRQWNVVRLPATRIMIVRKEKIAARLNILFIQWFMIVSENILKFYIRVKKNAHPVPL